MAVIKQKTGDCLTKFSKCNQVTVLKGIIQHDISLCHYLMYTRYYDVSELVELIQTKEGGHDSLIKVGTDVLWYVWAWALGFKGVNFCPDLRCFGNS